MSLAAEKFFRNQGVLTADPQERLRSAVVAIVGLGGTGGAAFECLLRLGCEQFILFDRDRFELSNFNRQLLATDETIDMKKTDGATKRANIINKNVKTSAFGAFDKKKIKNAEIVIDGTDNIETRIAISNACRAFRIPYVFCAASFASGMVSKWR
jgi:tRNA A37 threonylcarbamoyladenosine dehydratase